MKAHLFTLNASHAHSALAIRCLADALLDAGFSPTLSEATLKDRTHRVLAHLAAQRADLYGFSCYIWNISAMLSLAQGSESTPSPLPHPAGRTRGLL